MRSGFVSIVGAGPGDPDLLTLAARERLERADVVIADYLANPALLLWCRAGCEIVQRRRGPRSHAPLPAGSVPLTQSAVNDAMIQHARAGKRVVRLKGGDPCMFGRGAEEASVLSQHGIAYELVPGVSSPIAGPEVAGIPVTHRDYTPAVTFVSGFEAYDKAGLHVAWEHLARSAGTLVLMMSVGNARENAHRLVAAGRDGSTPAAIVRWGTRGIQQTIVGTLDDIADRLAAAGLRPPAVLIVGDVVRLREQVAWVEKRPLFSRRVAVTRGFSQSHGLRRALSELGADVVPIPCLAVTPPQDVAALHDALRRLPSEFDGVILTSSNGVDAAFDGLLAVGLDLRALAGKTIAVVGEATARACARRGIVADIVPDSPRAEGVVAALGERLAARWLYLRAAEGRALLPRAIAEAGGRCEVVTAYRTVRPRVPELLVQSVVAPQDGGEGLDVVCVASGTTARNFVQTLTDALGAEATAKVVHDAKFVALGPVTADAMTALGLSVDAIAKDPSDAAMIAAVAEALGVALATPRAAPSVA